MYPVSLQYLFDNVTGVLQVQLSTNFHVKAMHAPPLLFTPLALVRKNPKKNRYFGKSAL